MIDIRHGDCLEVLRTIPNNSVDSIVTDPPYGLSFMGKKWDYDVPSVEIWAECLRVLKPGGHLLAFAGTRTQHRMAVRIEDAGFEIRDMIAWVYSTGFPKSLNLDRKRGEEFCGCERTGEQKSECVLRHMRNDDISEAVNTSQKCGEVLQSGLQKQGSPASGWQELPAAEIRGEQSGMEGRSYAQASEGKLQGREVCQSAGVGFANGEKGRVHYGTPPCHGEDVRVSSDKNGGCGSPRPQPIEQPPIESSPVSDKRRPQAWRGWSVCSGCGKPIIPSGLGTALKPALEPITVARKPLIGTVAENVLAHGTGGLNIDGCRVGTNESLARPFGSGGISAAQLNAIPRGTITGDGLTGRWPANLIHDGGEEVLSAFVAHELHNNSSGAQLDIQAPQARFFYCAKASKRDRDEGLDGFNLAKTNDGRKVDADNAYQRGATLRANNHPTVKPTDLMRYLCRLVTPPNGIVLDPFTGSGSTGKAAILEGFRFIGIEREAEYVEIAKARIAAVSEQTRMFA